jgi:hypothetical protein
VPGRCSGNNSRSNIVSFPVLTFLSPTPDLKRLPMKKLEPERNKEEKNLAGKLSCF